jgi:inosine-uridine nucleoside N-ribohydrolase
VPRPIWIDTDIALGARSGDVDDAYAMATVLRSPELTLLGVSSVFGNTRAAEATRCARALLAAAGAHVEVVPGATRAGQVTAAAEAIAALPAGTTVLALGPLTNVAAALARDPSLASRISVSLVGGNLSSRGRWPPWWPFEFNLAKDAPAARALFATPTPRRLYPLDVCVDLAVGPRAIFGLRHASPLGAYLAAGSWRWLAYAPFRYRALGFPLWDLVPALDVAGLLPTETGLRRLRVEGRGLLVEDPAAPETVCITAILPGPALAAFERLLTARGT